MTDTPNYVSSWIHGGLGNQLFQIASALEYAKKYKKLLYSKMKRDYGILSISKE